MSSRNRIIGTILAIIILRILIFPSIWPAATLVGIIWAWVFLQNCFPEHKKIVSFGIIVLVLLTTWQYVVTPYAYPYTQRTVAASERRLLFWDTKSAEKIDPPMLGSVMSASSHLQWLEDRVGLAHANRLRNIRTLLVAGRITPEAARDSTETITAEIETWRAKTSTMSAKIISAPQAQNSPRQTQQQVVVQLDPVRWSGWFIIPQKGSWKCKNIGWIEYQLPNGETKKFGESHKGDMDIILSSKDPRFRLRGPSGEAEVTINN